MNKTLIIAEAGVNHNGDMKIAKKLVDAASEAKADLVKFQTFKTELGISVNAKKARYQKIMTGSDESQFEMVKKLEFSNEDFLELQHYCNKKNIKFFSTAFDLPSIDFLNTMGLDLFKIPSGEITNLPYLRYIGRFNKPIIMSTGMATLKEINEALCILVESGVNRNEITILHCTTEYPAPINEVNLNAMNTIKDELDVKVGYSDHTMGIDVSIAAVALGAVVIEKHLTIDKKLPGPDHSASIEPDDFKSLVSSIRNIEKAMGSANKVPSKSERKNIAIARKSIVASSKIKKGEVFTEKNITVKRPGNGISPMKWDQVLGKKASQNFNVDDLIQ